MHQQPAKLWLALSPDFLNHTLERLPCPICSAPRPCMRTKHSLEVWGVCVSSHPLKAHPVLIFVCLVSLVPRPLQSKGTEKPEATQPLPRAADVTVFVEG